MSSTPRHGRHAALLLAALLASAVTVVTPQPAPPGGGYDDDYASGQGQQQQAHVSTAMVALLAGVIAVFLFIAFSTIYLRHCSGAYAVRSDADGRRAAPLDHGFVSWSWSRWQPQRRRQRPRGLNADVVEAFPTMKYAEAKALRVGTKQQSTGALECAVCLSEFEDEDRLRLLPKCSHAFHPDCIGEWLAGHVTCPVCRCNLDPSKDGGSDDDEQPSFATALTTNSVFSAGEVVAAAARQDGGGGLPVAVVIDVVTAEEEEERRREAAELQQIGSQRRAMRRSRSARPPVATQLARSHSTGHSLAVRLDRDLERFTLRLPEHVRREMVAAAAAAGEHTRRGRRAAGEARSAPLGRWQSLLAGTFSGNVLLLGVEDDGGQRRGVVVVVHEGEREARGRR